MLLFTWRGGGGGGRPTIKIMRQFSATSKLEDITAHYLDCEIKITTEF